MKDNKIRYLAGSLLFPGLIFIGLSTRAQTADSIDLFGCHRSALETHPLQSQKALYERSRDLKQENLAANWFPSLDLNGRYTWQNEVVEIPFPAAVPGFETPLMPHYNYRMTLDVRQTLYDGGLSKKNMELEESIYQVNRQQVEVNLNQLKTRVNQVYFHILVLQQQEKILDLKSGELEKRISVMESLVRNETALSSDLKLLRAENLKVRQQVSEVRISRAGAMNILSELTSLNIREGTVLILPSAGKGTSDPSHLPEYVLYDLQIRNLDASMDLVQRKRYPKAYVFGQFGYGNPALNFFRDEFRGYYILGAGLQWNIWDWSKTNREKQVLAVGQDLVRSRRESFDMNLQIQLEEQQSGILKFTEAIERDREILELRKEISSAAASQLENGLITSSDYIIQLNGEIQARLQLELHRIQLEQARINYLTTKGII
jgi:outer membrane protein TolC